MLRKLVSGLIGIGIGSGGSVMGCRMLAVGLLIISVMCLCLILVSNCLTDPPYQS